MKKAELFEMAAKTCADVQRRNSELTNEKIRKLFVNEDEDSKISLDEAISKAMVLSLTLVPEISAAVTAELLVRLGLVELEDAE